MKEQTFNLYRDIAERTDGDVYIGVVGPVRTGKSTLISRMMQELVLAGMTPGPKRDRLSDELPQSGSGRTIMTTQPKFVPSEAVTVTLGDQATVRVRMVEYTAGYLADHWCVKGHILLCLEGELHTELEDGRRFVLRPGMSYQ
ncbi:MAG: DHCW motif cupin fold protein, partial [Clostridia bacterium]